MISRGNLEGVANFSPVTVGLPERILTEVERIPGALKHIPELSEGGVVLGVEGDVSIPFPGHHAVQLHGAWNKKERRKWIKIGGLRREKEVR